MKPDSSASNLQARQVELEAFASHYGLRFLPDLLEQHLPGLSEGPELCATTQKTRHEVQLLHRFAGMWPFREGFLRHVKDLIFGTYAGLEWTIFDYGYGQAMDTYGVVCARIPVNMTALHLCPESFLHRLESRLCVHELTMECQEFNERYFIRADDTREAFDILHPQAIEYLLALPGRDWQLRGCQVVLAQRAAYGIQELPKVMGEIDGFVRLIPGYVLEDRGIVPDWKGPFG